MKNLLLATALIAPLTLNAASWEDGSTSKVLNNGNGNYAELVQVKGRTRIVFVWKGSIQECSQGAEPSYDTKTFTVNGQRVNFYSFCTNKTTLNQVVATVGGSKFLWKQFLTTKKVTVVEAGVTAEYKTDNFLPSLRKYVKNLPL